MRRISALAATTLCVVAVPLASSASAVAKPVPGKYANCASLNAKYPHGVGKPGAKDHVAKASDVPVKNFTVNTSIYNLNARALDRDGDGIACEKH